MPYLARGKPFSAHVSRSIDKSGTLGRVEENRVQVEEEGEEAGDGDGEKVHRGRRKCYLLWYKSKREREGGMKKDLEDGGMRLQGVKRGFRLSLPLLHLLQTFFPFLFGSAIGTWKSFSLAGQDRHELRKGNMLEPCLCVARVESD